MSEKKELNTEQLEKVSGGVEIPSGLTWYHIVGNEVHVYTNKTNSSLYSDGGVEKRGYYVNNNDANIPVIYINVWRNPQYTGWYADKNNIAFYKPDKLTCAITEV